jgi:hypothetical protein
LYRYQQQHPRIFMPDNKEPRFFCNYPVHLFEFGSRQFHPNIVTYVEDYRRLYQAAPADAICGEASTDYLSCPGADKRIHAWNPATKIIIMLRDPLERAYSEYRHSIAANFQDASFWESICKEEERYEERYDPIFFHRRRGLYYRSVKNYMETFGRDNVRVILAEQFAKRTKETVESVFEFLGVEACPVDTSVRYNADMAGPATRRFEPRLQRLAIKLFGRRSVSRLFDLPDPRRLKKELKGARGALSRDEYESFRSTFVQDVQNLEDLLQRDLSHWLKPYDDTPPALALNRAGSVPLTVSS